MGRVVNKVAQHNIWKPHVMSHWNCKLQGISVNPAAANTAVRHDVLARNSQQSYRDGYPEKQGVLTPAGNASTSQLDAWTRLGQLKYDGDKFDQSFSLKTPRKVLLTFAAHKSHLGSSCFTPQRSWFTVSKWVGHTASGRTQKEFLCPELWTF